MNLNLTPNAVPRHWSSAYVGKPWELGAEGPDAFDCWGLARWIQRVQYGRELPQLRVGRMDPSPAQTAVLLELMRDTGWQQLPQWEQMDDGDLLRMRSPLGPHIGISVRRGARSVTVLHCLGAKDKDGVSHGAAEVAEPRQLVAEGFGRFEAWRWTA